MIIGSSAEWNDLFPWHLLPRIFDLVTETWESFEPPDVDAQEPPISKRFRTALKQAKDYKKLPFLIMREDVEDDFLTGDEIGRKDIVFYPTLSNSREEVYFVFECKRLNAISGARFVPLAPDYVSKGMARFVSGQYSRFMNQGGMIGYVLDGRCDHAIDLVAKNIRAQHDLLKMAPPGEFRPCRFRPAQSHLRETEHALPRPFIIHHIFLSCLRSDPEPNTMVDGR